VVVSSRSSSAKSTPKNAQASASGPGAPGVAAPASARPREHVGGQHAPSAAPARAVTKARSSEEAVLDEVQEEVLEEAVLEEVQEEVLEEAVMEEALEEILEEAVLEEALEEAVLGEVLEEAGRGAPGLPGQLLGLSRAVAGSTVRAGVAAVEAGAHLTSGAARRAAEVVEGAPAPRGPQRAPASVTVHLPFFNASVGLPGPGAVAKVGPVQVTLPTGFLYFGGLALLAAAGTVELPVVVGVGVAGAVLGRRWLRRPAPQLSAFDAQPGRSPV